MIHKREPADTEYSDGDNEMFLVNGNAQIDESMRTGACRYLHISDEFQTMLQIHQFTH